MADAYSRYCSSKDSSSSGEESGDNSPRKVGNTKRFCRESVAPKRKHPTRKIDCDSSSCNDVSNTYNSYTTNCNKRTKGQGVTTKNAILARENRRKKKLYVNALEEQVTSLKGEIQRLRASLNESSKYTKELKNDLKSMRSFLMNSQEIGSLLKAINTCTGLPIRTSLQKTTGYGNVPNKNTVPIAKKTAFPFNNSEDTDSAYVRTPSYSTCSELDNFDMDMPKPMSPGPFASRIDDTVSDRFLTYIDGAEELPKVTLNDHNYSALLSAEPDDSDDVYGMCLHVSNKKLSLEFCSECNNKAIANWSDVI